MKYFVKSLRPNKFVNLTTQPGTRRFAPRQWIEYETLGTLPLKLGWDERDTMVRVRASRHANSYMSIGRWQARF